MFSYSLDPRAHARHPRTGSPLPSLSVFLPIAWEETLMHAQKRQVMCGHYQLEASEAVHRNGPTILPFSDLKRAFFYGPRKLKWLEEPQWLHH